MSSEYYIYVIYIQSSLLYSCLYPDSLKKRDGDSDGDDGDNDGDGGDSDNDGKSCSIVNYTVYSLTWCSIDNGDIIILTL